MIEIKAKTRSGVIQSFHVEEILEIDGKPYRGMPEDLRDAILHLEGRVVALENIISGAGPASTPGQ